MRRFWGETVGMNYEASVFMIHFDLIMCLFLFIICFCSIHIYGLKRLLNLYRFLQGPETDQGTVDKIRDAIREQREITVQLINYTKSGEIRLI